MIKKRNWLIKAILIIILNNLQKNHSKFYLYENFISGENVKTSKRVIYDCKNLVRCVIYD
jgi:hypothetical protein